jgi:hypothetical protein
MNCECTQCSKCKDQQAFNLIMAQVKRIPNADWFYWDKVNKVVDVYFAQYRIEYALTNNFELIRKG